MRINESAEPQGTFPFCAPRNPRTFPRPFLDIEGENPIPFAIGGISERLSCMRELSRLQWTDINGAAGILTFSDPLGGDEERWEKINAGLIVTSFCWEKGGDFCNRQHAEQGLPSFLI